MTAFAVVTAVSALIAYRFSHPGEEWDALLAWFAKQEGLWGVVANLPVGAKLAPVVAQVATLAAAAIATVRGLKAFGADPAVLLASMAERFRLGDASAQTSFRARFAEQFSEVTEALPCRMVIAIDDLDRCKPEAILEVMEAVNFLTSTGRCIVVFGMAAERVQAALALAFAFIAKELVILDDAAELKSETAEREKRRTYARDYLEKLINIEVTVPHRDDIPPHALLLQPKSATKLLQRAAKRVVEIWPLYLGTAAIGLGVAAGLYLNAPAPSASQPASESAQAQTPPARPPSSPKPSSEEEPALKPISRSLRNDSSAVVPGDDQALSSLHLLPGVVLVMAGIVLFGWWRLRTNWRTVSDSEEFEQALAIWSPVIAARRATPRAIKRFGNRIRYLAMLQQGEVLDRPAWRDVVEQVRSWLGRSMEGADSGQAAQRPSRGLKESRLIALGALFEALGKRWSDSDLLESLSTPWDNVETEKPSGSLFPPDDPREGISVAVWEAVTRALEARRDAFQDPWPPGPEELGTFDRLLAGVRMPGDVEILEPELGDSSEDEDEPERFVASARRKLPPAKKRAAFRK